jgi:hypothetical protein
MLLSNTILMHLLSIQCMPSNSNSLSSSHNSILCRDSNKASLLQLPHNSTDSHSNSIHSSQASSMAKSTNSPVQTCTSSHSNNPMSAA